MLGFSYYLSEPITEETRTYFVKMKENGFRYLFTSLHIPEEDQAETKRHLQQLLEIVNDLEFRLVADIDKPSQKSFTSSLLNKVTLRLDDGFSVDDIADLTQTNSIALNASTIDQDLVDKLQNQNVDFKKLQAWHNFYPRPETGLSAGWFEQRNIWLKERGFTTAAFISGDEQLRGPIKCGLPTLETTRYQDPLASLVTLKTMSTDIVLVGDPKISLSAMKAIKDYEINRVLDLKYHATNDAQLIDPAFVYHNRFDPARDVIRLRESRSQIKQNATIIDPINCVNRTVGSITMDNKLYGRYMGELQITKVDLKADPKVNVIGHIIEKQLPLLKYVPADQAIKFVPNEPSN